jgi:cytochrome c553
MLNDHNLKRRQRGLRIACAALAIGVGACSKPAEGTGGPLPVAPAASPSDFHDKAKPDPGPSAPTPPLTADSVFTTRCATCHGAKGLGDGPAAVALNPKPRNYSDVQWQKSVTDEQIKKTIVEGGASVGKSALMVPNPDLAGQQEVLDGLVKIVRGFAPKGGA